MPTNRDVVTGQHRLAVFPGDDPGTETRRGRLRRAVALALGERATAVPWALAGAALLYMGFLLGRFGTILSAMNWSSDAAFWPVLVEHLPPRGSGVTNLGNTPHYMTILFLALTRALPGHRTIWAWTPLLSTLAGVALIAWAARRAFGLRGAWLALCVGACGSFPVIQTIVPQGVRSWTWVADAILGAVLVGLVALPTVERPGRMRGSPVLGSAVLLGVTAFTGLTVASDPLFLVAGLGPFVLAAGITWLRHRDHVSRRLVLAAGGIAAAGALVLAPLVAELMARWGFHWTPVNHAFTFASYDVLLRNAGWLGEALLAFANGLFPSRPIGLVPLAMLASSCIGLVALATTLTRAGRLLLKPAGAGHPARTAHVAYWSLSALFVMGVYVVGTIPSGGGLGSSRYLVPVFYSVAALLPLCTGRSASRRMAVVAAAAVFCVVGISSQNVLVAFDRGSFSLPQDGRKVIAFLDREALTRGYAGYWDSHSITWHDWRGGGQASVYPVEECTPPASAGRTLCPFDLARSTSWYRPQQSTRTFVITGGAGPPAAALATDPPAAFGSPAQTAVLGVYTVFVYDYDVASRFGAVSSAGGA